MYIVYYISVEEINFKHSELIKLVTFTCYFNKHFHFSVNV